jgi:glycosyltransferase involved in cell wall biosynthesis
MVARHDAVSTAASDTLRAFRAEPDFEARLVTARCDFPELHVGLASTLGDLLLHPAFLEADALVYHFGIHHPFFDALIAGSGRARQIVAFHNVTPPEYLAPRERPLIERSLRQIHNFAYADRIWAVSPVNAAALEARGIDPAMIEVIPLAVSAPRPASLADKPAPPLELLFVGRIVPSKGVLELIEALHLVRRHGDLPFKLRLAGNTEFSDPAYVASVKQAVSAYGLSADVEFAGAVDDATLESLYHRAHILAIPSHHEGFCKPVIEGLRAGCVPVGFAAYNLPEVANGLGRLVPPGDREALAAALSEVMQGILRAVGQPETPSLPLDGGLSSVGAFGLAAREHVGTFGFERIARQMVQSVRALMRQG